MNKKLLFTVLAAAALSAQAQPGMTSSWSKTGASVIAAADANYKNKMAVDAQGNVLATGIFTTDFSFGKYDIEHIAASSYLLKYAADGSELWGVALSGAATITSVTTDADNNIYVAGTLADEVVFGTTSGNAITLAGMKASDGSFLTKQVASFVAKYSADGKLEAAKAFVPQYLDALKENFMYEPASDDVYFKINKVQCANGKLYASAVYTGSTTSNGFTFNGNYMDAWGLGFIFYDLASASVFSLNSELNVDGVQATIGVKEALAGDVKMEAETAMFAINGSKLYTTLVGMGTLQVTTLDKSEQVSFSMNDGNIEYGYVVSAIDLANNTQLASKTYSATNSSLVNANMVAAMEANETSLIISGQFIGAMPFDNTKASTGNNDLYTASLNASTLALNWGMASGVAEGDENKSKEVFTGLTTIGNYAYMTGYTETIDGNTETPASALAYWMDLSNGTKTDAAASITTGVAAGESTLASATISSGNGVSTTFSAQKLSDTGIASVKENVINVYPNPVADVLNFSEACDVTVSNILGAVVRKAEMVNSLNVADLATGYYLVKISTANGTEIHKVIKK